MVGRSRNEGIIVKDKKGVAIPSCSGIVRNLQETTEIPEKAKGLVIIPLLYDKKSKIRIGSHSSRALG